MKKDWDAIYQKQGVVQKEPSPFIVKNLPLLKGRGGRRVLDVACGTGRNTILLAENGFKVVGLDPSKEALEIMKEWAAERGVDKNIEAKKGIQQDMPFDDGSFDAVVALFTFHHNKFDGAKKTMEEFCRVLKSGGLLVMNCLSTNDHRHGKGEEIEPNTFIKFGEIDDDMPHHFFTENEIKQMLRKFNVLEFEEERRPSKPPFKPGNIAHWNIIAEKP